VCVLPALSHFDCLIKQRRDRHRERIEGRVEIESYGLRKSVVKIVIKGK
jgi:hypothetical protein